MVGLKAVGRVRKPFLSQGSMYISCSCFIPSSLIESLGSKLQTLNPHVSVCLLWPLISTTAREGAMC